MSHQRLQRRLKAAVALCVGVGLADVALLNFWLAGKAFPPVSPRTDRTPSSHFEEEASLKIGHGPPPLAAVANPVPSAVTAAAEPNRPPALELQSPDPQPKADPAQTPAGSLRPAATPPATQEMQEITIHFPSARSKLNAQARKTLRTLVVMLRSHPEANVIIGGHTDRRGSLDYNLWLSLLRARKVGAYLKRHGIAPRRVEVKGYGPHEPVARGNQLEDYAKNRRVEIRITADPPTKSTPPAAAKRREAVEDRKR